MNPADWLEITWDQVGATLLNRRDFRTPSGTIADFLVRHEGDNGASIWRSTMLKDSERLFRVEARAAEMIYSTFAEDFFVSLASFRLLQPEGRPLAEPLMEVRDVGPARMMFQYPASWKELPMTRLEDRCITSLVNSHEGTPTGQIFVETRVRREGLRLESLARDHAEYLKSIDIQLRGDAVVPVAPPPGFRAAAVYAPVGEFKGRRCIAPVVLYEHSQSLIALSLLGPSRDNSPEWWAINKRAFEIVRDSLKIGTDDSKPAPSETKSLSPPSNPTLPKRPRLLDAGSY